MNHFLRVLVVAPLLLAGYSAGSATPGNASALGIFDGHNDIGTVRHAGSVVYDSVKRTYLIAGGGENMWFTNDAFHFVWKRVSGDVALTAKAAFVGTGGNPHRK